MLCYTAICGVQNGSLQAEILIQVYELLTKLLYRIKHNDHNGRQEQAFTALIELKLGTIHHHNLRIVSSYQSRQGGITK